MGVKKREGLRVRHETIRPPQGQTHHWIAIVDFSEPTPNSEGLVPPVCSICRVTHGWFKARHVEIDQDGYGIVSEGIWKELQKVEDNAGFTLANTVTDPPAQILRQSPQGFDREVKGRDHIPEILTPKISPT